MLDLQAHGFASTANLPPGVSLCYALVAMTGHVGKHEVAMENLGGGWWAFLSDAEPVRYFRTLERLRAFLVRSRISARMGLYERCGSAPLGLAIGGACCGSGRGDGGSCGGGDGGDGSVATAGSAVAGGGSVRGSLAQLGAEWQDVRRRRSARGRLAAVPAGVLPAAAAPCIPGPARCTALSTVGPTESAQPVRMLLCKRLLAL